MDRNQTTRLKSSTQVIFINLQAWVNNHYCKIVAHHVYKKNKCYLITRYVSYSGVEQLKCMQKFWELCRVVWQGRISLCIGSFSKDGVFIDTAGRSHKNQQQLQELSLLLSQLSNKKVYLVLSLTTKYNDLKRILQMYSMITDFHIILTKMDETTCLGNLLNIRMLTSQPFSYITFGQNVPEDIELLSPQKVAKILLGSYED